MENYVDLIREWWRLQGVINAFAKKWSRHPKRSGFISNFGSQVATVVLALAEDKTEKIAMLDEIIDTLQRAKDFN